MNNIRWEDAAFTGSVRGYIPERRTNYAYYLFPQQDGTGAYKADTLLRRGRFDNVDHEFHTLEEAKRWCEMHYLLCKDEFEACIP